MKQFYFSVSALCLLAACGGNDVGQIDQEPVLTIVSEGITFKRTSNPNEGVRWREWSDNSRFIWFDTDLGIIEDTTLVQGTSIINSNSWINIEIGNQTLDEMILVGIPEAPTSPPVGSASYSGEAIMLINVSDSYVGEYDTITKFANASMNIDFGENSGVIDVESIDGNSRITSNVNAYSGTWLEGSGVFTSSGDRYEHFWYTGSEWISTKSYDAISESTEFEGSLTGNSGQGVAGVFLGDSHAVGISLE